MSYLRFYYYHWVDTSAGGLLVPDDIIHPVVSAKMKKNKIKRSIIYCNQKLMKCIQLRDTRIKMITERQ
jgi:hypothetical protein